jgi:hypothetical protein
LVRGALILVNLANNEKLILLLNNWSKDPSGKNFESVMNEIINGDSFMILPCINNYPKDEWITSVNEKLELTCIFEVEGVKILGAFTDNEAISIWSKGKSQPYIVMKTKSVLELCEMNNIYKIVINSDSPNIFLVERSRKHVN